MKKILCLVLFATTFAFLNSCDSGTGKNTAKTEGENKRGEVVDSLLKLGSTNCNTSGDPTPILRLGKLLASGQIVPVGVGSVGGGNVHVITHGWAPYYLTAVNDYKANHPGGFLKAWDPEARETENGQPTGERYFVSEFIPLGLAILAADPGSTVLCFTWIDHSATDSVDDPWLSEDCTTAAGYAMFNALKAAFSSGSNRKLHLLGHSHGARVVTVAGILEKRTSMEQVIQITLFDSPERAVLPSANNNLAAILPQFEPNRTNRFVENYISYYGSCYSQNPSLNQIVDITLRPSYHGCWSGGVEDCITCAHEYGIGWYAGQTNPPSGFGLGWSPLINQSVAPSLSQYYLQDEYQIGIAQANGCQQGVIWSCEDPLPKKSPKTK